MRSSRGSRCSKLRGWYPRDRRFNEELAILRQCAGHLPGNVSASNNLAWFLATCEDSTYQDPAAALGSGHFAGEEVVNSRSDSAEKHFHQLHFHHNLGCFNPG
jgi:hypothetical protein